MIRYLKEMPRGPQKKLTKYNAEAIAKELLIDHLAGACYSLERDEYNKYSDEEKELISNAVNKLGSKMAKAIGKEYFTF